MAKTVPVVLSDSVDKLILRVGNLQKLIRVMALVLRVELSDKRSVSSDIFEVSGDMNMIKKIGEVSASEYNDAWNFLIAHDQKLRLDQKDVKRLAPITIAVKLCNYNVVFEHVVVGAGGVHQVVA